MSSAYLPFFKFENPLAAKTFAFESLVFAVNRSCLASPSSVTVYSVTSAENFGLSLASYTLNFFKSALEDNDKKVAVSSGDNTPGYLRDKLVVCDSD